MDGLRKSSGTQTLLKQPPIQQRERVLTCRPNQFMKSDGDSSSSESGCVPQESKPATQPQLFDCSGTVKPGKNPPVSAPKTSHCFACCSMRRISGSSASEPSTEPEFPSLTTAFRQMPQFRPHLNNRNLTGQSPDVDMTTVKENSK